MSIACPICGRHVLTAPRHATNDTPRQIPPHLRPGYGPRCGGSGLPAPTDPPTTKATT